MVDRPDKLLIVLLGLEFPVLIQFNSAKLF